MFDIGLSVTVKGELGHIRFIGPTEFAPGIWYGVELDTPTGKNSGSVKGVRYFNCQDNHGIFVRQSLLGPHDSASPMSSTRSSSPANLNESNLHRIIQKLQSKLHVTTQEIKTHNERIGLLESEIREYQESMASLESLLEMTSVDRDFQLSVKTRLESDLELLKLQYEELKTDYQILQEEIELNNQIEKEVLAQIELDEVTEVDVKFLVARNKKLEVSLRNLESMSTTTQTKLKTEIDTLTSKIKEQELELLGFSDLKETVATSTSKLKSLQMQLDTTSEMERIIEHMNLENEKLTLKISQLESTVKELNELHELDKSLEENQRLVEEDLRKHIKSLLNQIKKDGAALKNLETTNKYMESKLSAYKHNTKEEINTPDTSFIDTSEGDYNSKLTNELDSLKLQIFHYKSLNLKNELASRISQNKMALLLEKMNLPHYFQHKETLDLIFEVKLVAENIQLLIDTVKSDPHIEHNNLLLCSLQVLVIFLQELIMNLEFTSDIRLGKALLPHIIQLSQHTESLVDTLVEVGFAGLDCKFVFEFMLTAVSLVGIFEGFNSLIIHFVHSATRTVCTASNDMVNQIRSKSDLHLLDDLSEELFAIAQQTSILELNLSQEVRLDTSLDLVLFIKSLSDMVLSVTEIMDQISNHDKHNTSLEDLQLDPLLSSVSSQVATISQLCKSSYSLVPISRKSIYDSIVEEREASTSKNEEEEDFTRQLLEKDRKLHELRLNIELLENNMKSIHRVQEEKVSNLRAEIEDTKARLTQSEERVAYLREENDDLVDKLHELLKSNQIFENGDLFDTFNDLATENAFTKNMGFVDEMVLLRKLACYNFDSQLTTSQTPSWLLQPLTIGKPNDITPASKFNLLSKDLRELALRAEPIDISKLELWKPRKSAPRFISLALHEEYLKYSLNRDSLLK